MKSVAIGLIGCGAIGWEHLQNAVVSKRVNVVALADLRPEQVQKYSKEFHVETTYPNDIELLADPKVEAVILAVPTGVRAEIALRAFAAGKHVLIEKPVAMNAAELEQMIAARGNLVSACCSSRFRHLESANLITSLIAEGELGELRTVYCRVIQSAGQAPQGIPALWRLSKKLNGGGILVNWGCYDLDYLLGITGWNLKPKQVLAQTWTLPQGMENYAAPDSDGETHVVAAIRCEDGCMIQYERAEVAGASSEQAWQLIGTKGSLHLTILPGNRSITMDFIKPNEGVFSKTIWDEQEFWSTAHGGVLEDFAQAIQEGIEPKTTLEHALIMQNLVDAIYKSSDLGEAVTID